MICDDCKKCNYFFVSEVGCYGSDKPCENFFPSDYEFPNSEEAIKAIEISAKKAQEAIEVFKQGLDKAEEQAKQILNEIPTGKWICNPTYCYKCNQTNCGADMREAKE